MVDVIVGRHEPTRDEGGLEQEEENVGYVGAPPARNGDDGRSTRSSSSSSPSPSSSSSSRYPPFVVILWRAALGRMEAHEEEKWIEARFGVRRST
jgi:hypothetical protein